MENTEKKPKFKIGDKVFATWAGGHRTSHIITSIENTEHGFWYSWERDSPCLDCSQKDFGSGLHEMHLSRC